MARKIILQGASAANTVAYMPPPSPGMGIVGLVGWVGGVVAMVVCGIILFLSMQQQGKLDQAHLLAVRAMEQDGQRHIDQLNQESTALRQQLAEDTRKLRPLETNQQTIERNIEKLKATIAAKEGATAASAENPAQAQLRREAAALQAQRATLMTRTQELDNQIMATLAKWQPVDKPPTATPAVVTPDPDKPVGILDPKSKINVNNLALTFLTDRSKSKLGYDDVRQTLNMSAKLTNKDTVRDLMGAKVEVYAFAENLFEKDQWILLRKKVQSVDLTKRATVELDLGQATMYYNKTGSDKWGYRYDGYMIFLFDASGALLKVETNRTQFTKIYDKLSKVRERHSFDKNGNDLGSYTYYIMD